MRDLLGSLSGNPHGSRTRTLHDSRMQILLVSRACSSHTRRAHSHPGCRVRNRELRLGTTRRARSAS